MLERLLIGLQLLSAMSFLYYGVLCLVSADMVKEFERYRLAKYRRLTGFLELIGGLGQLVGLYSAPLLLLSSAGLAGLMICGIWARARIQDPWYLFLPAIVLFAVNIALVFVV